MRRPEGARRGTAVGGVGGLLLFVLAAVSCTRDTDDDSVPEGQPVALEDRLADPPAGFRFSYQARGTDVLDCVLPNRDFEGTVFPDDTLSIAIETPAGPASVVAFRDGVYLDTELFAAGSVDADALRFERARLADVRQPLDRILGVALAAYIAAPGPPPSGAEVVSAALEQTSVDSRLDPIRLPGGVAAAGYRLVVEGDGTVPVIDAWIDDEGVVVRVQVQDSLADRLGQPNPDTGWVIDYRPLPADATAPRQPADVVDATAELLGALAPPPQEGCDLEIGPAPTGPVPQP